VLVFLSRTDAEGLDFYKRHRARVKLGLDL
jgi:hypothetical protein